MTPTYHALVAVLLTITLATGCATDPATDPAGPSGDSIIGHDLALAPLHYTDPAGRLYELLLAIDDGGSLSAACYMVDGALFACIAPHPADPAAEVQIYDGGRAAFRAVVTPAAVPGAAGVWPAFAGAAADTRDALAVWQRSASGGALARLYAAVGRLASASAALLAATDRPGG